MRWKMGMNIVAVFDFFSPQLNWTLLSIKKEFKSMASMWLMNDVKRGYIFKRGTLQIEA